MGNRAEVHFFNPFVSHYQLSGLTGGQLALGKFVELRQLVMGKTRRDSSLRCILRSFILVLMDAVLKCKKHFFFSSVQLVHLVTLHRIVVTPRK